MEEEAGPEWSAGASQSSWGGACADHLCCPSPGPGRCEVPRGGPSGGGQRGLGGLLPERPRPAHGRARRLAQAASELGPQSPVTRKPEPGSRLGKLRLLKAKSLVQDLGMGRVKLTRVCAGLMSTPGPPLGPAVPIGQTLPSGYSSHCLSACPPLELGQEQSSASLASPWGTAWRVRSP